MLDGKELPPLSEVILNSAPSLFFLALALPIAACAIFFTLRHSSFGVPVLLFILLMIGTQLLVTRKALFEPLTQIVSGMSSL